MEDINQIRLFCELNIWLLPVSYISLSHCVLRNQYKFHFLSDILIKTQIDMYFDTQYIYYTILLTHNKMDKMFDYTSPMFRLLKWITDLCCFLIWSKDPFLLYEYPCFSSNIRYQEWTDSVTSSDTLCSVSLVNSK